MLAKSSRATQLAYVSKPIFVAVDAAPPSTLPLSAPSRHAGAGGEMPCCTKCGAIGHNRRSCGREKRPAVRKQYPRRSKSGAPRVPGKYRCSRCSKPGHNRVRCLRLDQQQAWVTDRRQRVVCDDIDTRTPFERALSPPFQILRNQRATCVELMRTLVGMVCVEVWRHERSLERGDSHIL